MRDSSSVSPLRSLRLYLLPLLALMVGGCQVVPYFGPPGEKRTVRAEHDAAAAEVEASIDRGVQFLVEDQNPDGSWGSVTRTKGLNIYAPIPGAHHAFRAATTALCISALIEAGSSDEAAVAALEKGEAWLLEHLPQVRRAEMTAIYNTWAHAYGISALVRMHERKPDHAERQQKIREIIAQQIDLLGRYEFVGGGWGYYDFDHHLSQPGGAANSFTSATVLIAFAEAQQIGVEVPQRLRERGTNLVERQRKPDFTYLYSANFDFYTMREINRPGGSLGRSQACNAALRMWGDEAVSDTVISDWLTKLFERNGWLGMGRKRPVPHESHFAVAGYFFYYGHFYAAMCIELLPVEQRPEFQKLLAKRMMELQEKDGSWWDYPLYDYHQPYGTSFALMSLVRCRSEVSQSRKSGVEP